MAPLDYFEFLPSSRGWNIVYLAYKISFLITLTWSYKFLLQLVLQSRVCCDCDPSTRPVSWLVWLMERLSFCHSAHLWTLITSILPVDLSGLSKRTVSPAKKFNLLFSNNFATLILFFLLYWVGQILWTMLHHVAVTGIHLVLPSLRFWLLLLWLQGQSATAWSLESKKGNVWLRSRTSVWTYHFHFIYSNYR